MIEFLLVAAFGGIGSVARAMLAKVEGKLPWGILIANTLATTLAAFVLMNYPSWSLSLVVGIAGGLSTFSTFIAGTWKLLADGRRFMAFWNIILNVLLPSTAVLLVVFAGRGW
jgi:CrcB protein